MTMEMGDCLYRGCKRYWGWKNNRETCEAFPRGIPDEIRLGGLEHTVPFREDGGDQDEAAPGLLFEPGLDLDTWKPHWPRERERPDASGCITYVTRSGSKEEIT